MCRANAELIVRAVNEHDALAAVAEAAREFVARCERGEVRSVKSRAAFEAALARLKDVNKSPTPS